MKIVVQDSPIHGRGVFAESDILPGEIIIDWRECSEILHEKDLEELSPEERKRVSFIDAQWILFGPPACCVNHFMRGKRAWRKRMRQSHATHQEGRRGDGELC